MKLNIKLVAGKDVMDVVTQIALLKATKAMNDFDKEIISYIRSIYCREHYKCIYR